MRVNVRGKLLGLSAILIAFMLGVGVLSIINLGSVDSQAESMYTDRAVPIQQLGDVSTQFMNIRRLAAYGVAVIGDAATQATIDKGIADAAAPVWASALTCVTAVAASPASVVVRMPSRPLR